MKRLTIDDMDRLVYLSVPDLKPDGTEAVYTAARAREDGCSFTSEVYRISLPETTEQAGNSGSMDSMAVLLANDSEMAKYSPDGSQIAFLCKKSGENQIWIWENGNTRQLTCLLHGVSDFSWAPDGQSLVWEAPLWQEELDRAFEEMTSDQKKSWEQRKARKPIVVEELIYKLDEVGLFDGSVHQIGVTDMDGNSRLLTRTPYEHRKPVFSPDSRNIACYAYPDGSVHRLRAQIFLLPVPERQSFDFTSSKEYNPISSEDCDSISPDEHQITHEDYLIDSWSLLFDPADESGKSVVVMTYIKQGEGQEEHFVQLPQIFSLESGSFRPLFEAPCPSEEINNMVVGRNAVGRESAPYSFSEDGQRFYYTSLWGGNQNLYCYDRNTKEFSCLTEGEASVQALAAPKCGRMVYLKGTPVRPAELYCKFQVQGGSDSQDEANSRNGANSQDGSNSRNGVNSQGGVDFQQIACGANTEGKISQGILPGDISEQRLTWENEWLAEYEIAVPVPLDIPSGDGKARIHGWYMKPSGLQEGEKVPAVLDIHGGPDCGYSSNFWFEFQYLAANGMAVVYCDPRGSVGYGAAHRQGDCTYGKEAQEDLLAFLDAVIALGFVDGAKCGVTGGSYGGYMTNRLVGMTDRFAAAVTQRNLCNLGTSYGTGDMGFVTGKKDFHGMMRMLKDRVSARATTLRFVDKIKTPLLILHGTADYRCSFEQGEQLFIAMKERNPKVPVRFVAFPGENHGLTRGGRPLAQKAHLKEMADWFVKYLREAKEPEESSGENASETNPSEANRQNPRESASEVREQDLEGNAAEANQQNTGREDGV